MGCSAAGRVPLRFSAAVVLSITALAKVFSAFICVVDTTQRHEKGSREGAGGGENQWIFEDCSIFTFQRDTYVL